MFVENLCLVKKLTSEHAAKAFSFRFHWGSFEGGLVRSKYYSSGISKRTYLFYGLVFLYVVQWACAFDRSTMDKELISTMCVIALVLNSLCLIECHRRASDIIKFVNGLIQFDRMYRGNVRKGFWTNLTDQSLLAQLNILYSVVAYISSLIFPVVFTYGLHYSSPCKSSLLFYRLIDQCQNDPNQQEPPWVIIIPRKMLNTAVYLLNQWTWTYSMCMAAFVIGVLQTIATISLTENMKTFSSFYRHSTLPFNKLVIMYRQVQILGKLENIICQKVITTTIIFGCLLVLPFATTTMIKSISKSPTEGESGVSMEMYVSALVLMLNTAGIIMVSFKGMSGAYKESKKAKQSLKLDLLKQVVRPCEMKKRRKFERSFQPVKIQFGQFNFFESDTTLNMLDFSNNLTINLLLLT